MVAYSDVPAVNLLYQEQATIDRAIELIDNGGVISNFTVSPLPPDPGAMGAAMQMPAMISTVNPTPELMADARVALVERHNAIAAELMALGVTETPPVI
jgi:hypothetical protein